MAAKIEYVVVEGCIQDGSKVVRKGEVYVPSSPEIREALLEEGIIAARGKLDAGGRASRRQPSSGALAPLPTKAPGDVDPEEEEEEEEEEEDDGSGA